MPQTGYFSPPLLLLWTKPPSSVIWIIIPAPPNWPPCFPPSSYSAVSKPSSENEPIKRLNQIVSPFGSNPFHGTPQRKSSSPPRGQQGSLCLPPPPRPLSSPPILPLTSWAPTTLSTYFLRHVSGFPFPPRRTPFPTFLPASEKAMGCGMSSIALLSRAGGELESVQCRAPCTHLSPDHRMSKGVSVHS